MSWIFLSLAIVFEVAGTTSLKYSKGFTLLLPSVLLILFYSASFYFLSKALLKLEVGLSYAIWSGLGTALITILGVILFKDVLSPGKIFFLVLIVVGVIGLHFS